MARVVVRHSEHQLGFLHEIREHGGLFDAVGHRLVADYVNPCVEERLGDVEV